MKPWQEQRQDNMTLTDQTPQATDRQLYRVKHDFELPDGGRPHPNMPEVFRLEPHTSMKFTEAWQRFCFKLVKDQRPDLSDDALAQKFKTMYDSAFMNDNRFRDHRANFITGENLNNELPRVFDLVCGGNVLAGTEDGDDLIVETLNGREPPPSDVSPDTHPWLFQKATIITSTKLQMIDGMQTFKVIRFPELSPADSIVPIVSIGPVRYPLNKLVRLPLGSPIPSPYLFE